MSDVVILEALEDDEWRTGEQLAGYIARLDDRETRGLGIYYRRCGYRDDFVAAIRALAESARTTGRKPVLHIECHGDRHSGLYFPNASELSWSDLADELRALNQATELNLFVVVSACHGGYLLEQLDTSRAAPCLAFLGPTEEVSPSDIMGGLMYFYRNLFATLDITQAASGLKSMRLDSGSWLVQSAEGWFLQLATRYVKDHCTKHAARERVAATRRRLLDAGRDVSMSILKRLLKEENRRALTGRMYETYFMIDQLPANRSRFAMGKRWLELRLEELSRTGRYAI